MNRKVTYFLILTFLMPFTVQSSVGFQQKLEHCPDPEVKKRLLAFEKDGIEKACFTYDLEKVITYAESFKGTKHKMGGIDKTGIDCSGLVYSAHAKYGVQLPHSSQQQARFGLVIPTFSELKRGDLVFYYNSYKTANFITHVGIYLGHGKMLHTSSSKGVIISDVDDKYYWGERFLFGTRLNK